jgi:hypothetical protein
LWFWLLVAPIGLAAERWAVLLWGSVALQVVLALAAQELPVVPERIAALELPAPVQVPAVLERLAGPEPVERGLVAPELVEARSEALRFAVVTCQVGRPAAASQLRMAAAGEVEEAVGLKQQWLSVLEITAVR